MRRVTRTLLFAVLVLAVAAVSATSAAAGGNEKGRPHRANATGTRTIAECVGAPPGVVVCPQETATTLIGTHLGRSVSTGTGEITFDFGAPPCLASNGALGTPVVSTLHVVTVAANGAELYSDNVTTRCGFAGPGSDDGLVGTYTITGGTGRFEGATGSGTLTASVLDGAITTTWSGTLTY